MFILACLDLMLILRGMGEGDNIQGRRRMCHFFKNPTQEFEQKMLLFYNNNKKLIFFPLIKEFLLKTNLLGLLIVLKPKKKLGLICQISGL